MLTKHCDTSGNEIGRIMSLPANRGESGSDRHEAFRLARKDAGTLVMDFLIHPAGRWDPRDSGALIIWAGRGRCLVKLLLFKTPTVGYIWADGSPDTDVALS